MSLAQTQSVKTWLKIQEVDGANQREVALNRRDMMSAIAQTDLVNSLNVPKVEIDKFDGYPFDLRSLPYLTKYSTQRSWMDRKTSGIF